MYGLNDRQFSHLFYSSIFYDQMLLTTKRPLYRQDFAGGFVFFVPTTTWQMQLESCGLSSYNKQWKLYDENKT